MEIKLKPLLISLLICFTVSSVKSNDERAPRRNSKLFPFLAFVRFPNEKCETDDTMEPGLCYSEAQCISNGGSPSSKQCAQGYGVCCIFRETAENGETVTIKNNQTLIMNSPIFSKLPTIRSPFLQSDFTKMGYLIKNQGHHSRYSVPKQSDVCQLRLDFRMFELGQSNEYGDCARDSMMVTGADNFEQFQICGHVNPGDHMYFHYGQSSTIDINFDLFNTSSIYNIQITQIKCNSLERAPDGCDQFYKESSGEVRSFNYKHQQLNNMVYAVCVKNPPGSKSIQWSKCEEKSMFKISGNSNLLRSQSGAECKTDYVLIPGTSGSKYCGGDFSSIPIESRLKPFLLYVHLDGEEIPRVGPTDPLTNCPENWSCRTASDDGSCPDPEYCDPPSFMAHKTDVGNKGFCLKYFRK